MDLSLLDHNWREIGVKNRDLRQSRQAVVIALLLLQDLGATQQSFEVLTVAAALLVKHLLKEVHGFGLQIFFHGGEVDPATHSLRSQVGAITFEALIDYLSSFFELTDVPQETGCSYQVTIICHFLALIHRQHKRVDRFLVNVAAPLMIVDQGLGCSELHLAPVLNSGQLSDRLIDVSFIENTEGLPENKNGVCALVKLLHTRKIERD